MVSLLKHLSVSKNAVIIRSKINEKQLVAIIIAELSDKSIHKSAIVYTKAQPDYWLHCYHASASISTCFTIDLIILTAVSMPSTDMCSNGPWKP